MDAILKDTIEHCPAPICIGLHQIDSSSKPYVVAEIGVNHNGDAHEARRLIDAAHQAGADAAKFQVFSAGALATTEAPAAEYQTRGAARSQREILEGLELPPESFRQIADHCRSVGIAFLATPFSVDDLQLVVDLGVPAIKLASTDINNFPLLDAVLAADLPLLVSTGASRASEIDETVAHIAGQDARARTILLHCVSNYPTAPHDASLSTIAHLQSRYTVWTGYSDHTESIEVAGLAVACGARVLEKHFTLDRRLTGPDHAFSLTPEMFRQYVQTAETAWRMMGRPRRDVADVEQEVRALARKSVVASRAIRRNERITADMLTLKRPGGGLEPKHLAALVGRTARRDIAGDAQVDWDMVD